MKRKISFTALAIWSVCAMCSASAVWLLAAAWQRDAMAAEVSADAGGTFEGNVVVEWLDDPYVLKLRLVEDFTFRESAGIWVVPAGTIVDGRSLPTLFVSLVGRPFESNFRKAALVYDYAAKSKQRSWDESQQMFYDALLAEGVIPIEAKVMYMLLNATGPRWVIKGSTDCYGRCHSRDADLQWSPRVHDDDVVALINWVRSEDPSLDEIRTQVQTIIIDASPHMIGRIHSIPTH